MFGKTQAFLKENGAYVLFTNLAGRPSQFLRDHMQASKFGVQQFHIGPRAHLRGLNSIRMGEDFAAGEGLWLEAVTRYQGERYSPKLRIGSHVRISHWSHIACTNSVTIGDHVLIGSKVVITDHNHGLFGVPATCPSIPPALLSDAFDSTSSGKEACCFHAQSSYFLSR